MERERPPYADRLASPRPRSGVSGLRRNEGREVRPFYRPETRANACVSPVKVVCAFCVRAAIVDCDTPAVEAWLPELGGVVAGVVTELLGESAVVRTFADTAGAGPSVGGTPGATAEAGTAELDATAGADVFLVWPRAVGSTFSIIERCERIYDVTGDSVCDP